MSTDFAPEMHERSTGFGTRFKEFIASIGFKWTQDQVGTDCGLSRRTVQGYLKKIVWPAPAECFELEAKLTQGASSHRSSSPDWVRLWMDYLFRQGERPPDYLVWIGNKKAPATSMSETGQRLERVQAQSPTVLEETVSFSDLEQRLGEHIRTLQIPPVEYQTGELVQPLFLTGVDSNDGLASYFTPFKGFFAYRMAEHALGGATWPTVAQWEGEPSQPENPYLNGLKAGHQFAILVVRTANYRIRERRQEEFKKLTRSGLVDPAILDDVHAGIARELPLEKITAEAARKRLGNPPPSRFYRLGWLNGFLETVFAVLGLDGRFKFWTNWHDPLDWFEELAVEPKSTAGLTEEEFSLQEWCARRLGLNWGECHPQEWYDALVEQCKNNPENKVWDQARKDHVRWQGPLIKVQPQDEAFIPNEFKEMMAFVDCIKETPWATEPRVATSSEERIRKRSFVVLPVQFQQDRQFLDLLMRDDGNPPRTLTEFLARFTQIARNWPDLVDAPVESGTLAQVGDDYVEGIRLAAVLLSETLSKRSQAIVAKTRNYLRPALQAGRTIPIPSREASQIRAQVGFEEELAQEFEAGHAPYIYLKRLTAGSDCYQLGFYCGLLELLEDGIHAGYVPLEVERLDQLVKERVEGSVPAVSTRSSPDPARSSSHRALSIEWSFAPESSSQRGGELAAGVMEANQRIREAIFRGEDPSKVCIKYVGELSHCLKPVVGLRLGFAPANSTAVCETIQSWRHLVSEDHLSEFRKALLKLLTPLRLPECLEALDVHVRELQESTEKRSGLAAIYSMIPHSEQAKLAAELHKETQEMLAVASKARNAVCVLLAESQLMPSNQWGKV